MKVAVITRKFMVWKDDRAYYPYIVTAFKARYIVYQGTYGGAMAFMEKHPNGLTRKEAIEISEQAARLEENAYDNY